MTATQRAACILPWRIAPTKTGETLEFLLVQRSTALATMAGFWAFPGGQLDASDDELAAEAGRASAAYAIAGLRELFEETGLLPPQAQKLAPETLSELRQALLGRNIAPNEVLLRLGLASDRCLSALEPFGHWQTPPFGLRRFDAHYFALEMPYDGLSSIDLFTGELAQGLWLTPDAALWAHEHNEGYLAMPVRRTLCVLAETKGAPRARVLEAASILSAAKPEMRLEVPVADGLSLMPVKSPTLPPATHTNCYMLGEGRVSIVDPGTPYPDETARLIGVLKARIQRGETLDAVWLTHYHPDHVGAAEALREAFGTPVYAHLDTAKRLVGRVRVDRMLEDDAVLPVGGATWRALHTPGHARGHLCFYEQERGHLLAGDNVLGTGTSIVMPRPEGDMRAYMQSLERLQKLKLGLLLPGHGPPMATSLKRLGDTLTQRKARERLILATVAQLEGGGRLPTLDAIVGKVYRGLAASLRGLGELSTRAHLEKLVEDGALSRIGGLSDAEARWQTV